MILPRRRTLSYTDVMENWDTRFISRSPLFAPLHAHGDCGAVLCGAGWPALAELQARISAHGIVSGGGQPLRLTLQDTRADTFEDRYEVRIFREGELQLRTHNWHDLFNVLAWMAFPLAKAAINARHYHALLEQQSQGALNRGPAQDALTLFDESGTIVFSSDTELLRDVRDFAWKQLFWRRRERVLNGFGCFIFGHALYEKALQPFEGMTGHGVLLDVDDRFRTLPMAQQLEALDQRLEQQVADSARFQATRELAPLPLLGMPGWWPANGQESFYDNTAYFRRGRRQAAAS